METQETTRFPDPSAPIGGSGRAALAVQYADRRARTPAVAV